MFVRAHDIELKNQHLLADALLEVILHGEPALLHIEFQSYDDTEPELEWFRKRFSMFQDILRESWVYQEIIEQGREEEHQRRIQEHRTLLMRFIQLNFPELEALAKQQADGIKDPDVLSSMNIKLLAAQRVEEARQILLSDNKGETKH